MLVHKSDIQERMDIVSGGLVTIVVQRGFRKQDGCCCCQKAREEKPPCCACCICGKSAPEVAFGQITIGLDDTVRSLIHKGNYALGYDQFDQAIWEECLLSNSSTIRDAFATCPFIVPPVVTLQYSEVGSACACCNIA